MIAVIDGGGGEEGGKPYIGWDVNLVENLGLKVVRTVKNSRGSDLVSQL